MAEGFGFVEVCFCGEHVVVFDVEPADGHPVLYFLRVAVLVARRCAV